MGVSQPRGSEPHTTDLLTETGGEGAGWPWGEAEGGAGDCGWLEWPCGDGADWGAWGDGGCALWPGCGGCGGADWGGAGAAVRFGTPEPSRAE